MSDSEDKLEKVEKLRKRANVTYEEAREALEQSGWDLLDAMVYLEKKGKVTPPETSVVKTDYENQKQYQNVQETVSEGQKKANEHSFSEKLHHLFQIIWDTLKNNTLHILHKDQEVIQLPLGVAILIILFTWEVVWIVILVSLFFDCKYHLTGKEDGKEDASETFNKVSDAACAAADHAKSEFNKL